MATRENRFIRIEDSKGNVYYPESNSDKSTAGSISKEASTTPGADPYTEGTYVADSKANSGTAIILSSENSRQTIYKASFIVPFGNVVTGLRFKSSIGSGTTNILELNTYFRDASGATPVDTLLDTTIITGDTIKTANEYVNLAHITNYTGTATGSAFFVVELIVLPDTGATIYFDQMYVSMEVASSGTGGGPTRDVYVEEGMVVVKELS